MEEYMKNTLPFWGGLTDGQRETIVRGVTVRRYQKGELIYNPLKKTRGLRLLKEGRIRIFVTSRDGRGLTLEWLGEGDICALSILNEIEAPDVNLCAEVEAEAQVFVIPGAVYHSICEENRLVWEFSHRIAVSSLSRMLEIISHAALATAQERMADLLLRSARKSRSTVLHLTHEGIARDIGSAREVVSRMLKQLEEWGILTLERGRLHILDEAALESVRNGQRKECD